MFPKDVAKLLTDLGVKQTAALSPAQVSAAVLGGASVAIQQPFACELKRSRVNTSSRLEIVGAPASQLPWLKQIGCFTEVIQYRTRLFVPTDEAEAILARLLAPAETGAP